MLKVSRKIAVLSRLRAKSGKIIRFSAPKESKDDNVTGYEVHTAKVSPSILQEVFPNSAAMIDSKININYGVRTFGGVDKIVVESIDIINQKGD